MAGRYRRKKHTVFKTFVILSALVLVVGATVAITLALLNNTSETKTNTFVSDNKLDVTLTEEEWENEGKEKAKWYTPGLKIPKDPKLTNTTGFLNEAGAADAAAAKSSLEYKAKSEYVAIKLQYQVLKPELVKEDLDLYAAANDDKWEDISYSDFRKLAKISNDTDAMNPFNETNWLPKTAASGAYAPGGAKENTVFYYKSILGPDITVIEPSDEDHFTVKLFDNVTIEQSLSQETIFECGVSGHFDGLPINGKSWPQDASSNPIKTWSNLRAMDADGSGGYTFATPAANKTAPYSYTKNAKTTYVHVGLVPFRIKVTGYAVQANVNDTPMNAPGNEAVGELNATEELDKLMRITTP